MNYKWNVNELGINKKTNNMPITSEAKSTISKLKVNYKWIITQLQAIYKSFISKLWVNYKLVANEIHPYGWKNDETYLDDVGDGDVGECLRSWHLRILANTDLKQKLGTY
jgi:hypothetical protein